MIWNINRVIWATSNVFIPVHIVLGWRLGLKINVRSHSILSKCISKMLVEIYLKVNNYLISFNDK
jgi:hypothetical protein